MGLYQEWEETAQQVSGNPAMQQKVWDEDFAAETEVYRQLLADHETAKEGTMEELAGQFGMTPVVFAGFMDGINTSLHKEYDISSLEADTPIRLDIDWEKLYFNMCKAKAKWLYTLPEWEDVLPPEARKAQYRAWQKSVQAVSEKTVGRNDPCPCGSGKKYKKCCGK